MRESIKQFVELCAKTLPFFEPIYEFGSYQVPGQEGFSDLRPLFSGKEYVGADIREGPGVDVILDLHDISLPSESVGTVLMLDTLEHVEFPRKSVRNLYRILKRDGILVISSVMNYPIHNYPLDFWRFTPQGLKSLMSSFSYTFVESLGNPEFPHTVVGLACKTALSDDSVREFLRQCQDWKQSWTDHPSPAWKNIARPFMPPIVIKIYRKILSARQGRHPNHR